MRRVVITGLGIVSSIGNNADEAQKQVRNGGDAKTYTKSQVTAHPEPSSGLSSSRGVSSKT